MAGIPWIQCELSMFMILQTSDENETNEQPHVHFIVNNQPSSCPRMSEQGGSMVNKDDAILM